MVHPSSGISKNILKHGVPKPFLATFLYSFVIILQSFENFSNSCVLYCQFLICIELHFNIVFKEESSFKVMKSGLNYYFAFLTNLQPGIDWWEDSSFKSTITCTNITKNHLCIPELISGQSPSYAQYVCLLTPLN